MLALVLAEGEVVLLDPDLLEEAGLLVLLDEIHLDRPVLFQMEEDFVQVQLEDLQQDNNIECDMAFLERHQL